MPKIKPITPEMVGYYVLRILTAADRKRVEKAFLFDRQVQSWFVDFNALPDNILNSDDPHIMETVAEVKESMIRRGLPVPNLPKPSNPKRKPRPGPVLPMPVRDERKGYRYSKELDFTLPLGCSPKRAPSSRQEEMKEHFELDDDHVIRFQCSETDNPNGLIWMTLRERDGIEMRKLLELEFNKKGKTWWSKVTLAQFYGERAADIKQVVPGFVPARDNNRDEFDNPEVRLFVESLPEGCMQRERAEHYLKGGENIDG